MENLDLNLLTSIYQNAKTATQSISDIISKVDNVDLKQELSNEMSQYEIILQQCEMIASNRAKELKDNTWIEKTRLWTSIKLTTLMDKSTRHLAEMLLLGTVMGTIQCYKDLSDYKKATKEYLLLAKKLLALEEKFFDNLKTFLK